MSSISRVTKKRNQLFRVLEGTEIFAAAGHDGRSAIRDPMRPHLHLTARFAGRVGCVGLYGRALGKLACVDGPIHFIRRNVQHPFKTLMTGRVQQSKDAINIGLNEAAGFKNAAVVMAFRREVEDVIDFFRQNNAVDDRLVLNFTGVETEAPPVLWIVLHVRHRREIACISKGVQYDDPVGRVLLQDVSAVVAANKSRAPGDKQGFGCLRNRIRTHCQLSRCDMCLHYTVNSESSSSCRISSTGSFLAQPAYS